MTDKERLEEMKGIISTWKTILSEGNFADVTSEEVELVEYVIQQAERAQKLERENKILRGEKGIKSALNDKAVEIIENNERQNQHYKETLEFYADETMYEAIENYDGEREIYIERDGGEKARQTLEMNDSLIKYSNIANV